MKTKKLLFISTFFVFHFSFFIHLNAQIITTIAGNGVFGYSGDGGQATAAEMNNPNTVEIDHSGNIFVSDQDNNVIRLINTSGIISTLAGNGVAGFSGDGGPATAAEFNVATGTTMDSSQNIYVVDYNNERIRKINPSGIITTVAGDGTAGNGGNGSAATLAELNHPTCVIVDDTGNLYIADDWNNVIRKVNTSGIITVIAGNGLNGFGGDGGNALSAEFNYPIRVAFDKLWNLYIVDSDNSRIRKVNSSGIITTVAGNGTAAYAGDGGPATAAEINVGWGALCFDAAGNMYIADAQNSRIRKVNTSGIISTTAGNGIDAFSGDGGPASAAEIYWPTGVSIDIRNNLYIADLENARVREIISLDTASACNFWTRKASLPAVGREGAAGFSIGHYGFIGTGQTSSGFIDDFWRWNQDSNTWTAVAGYPGAGRGYMTSFTIAGKGYCGLGYTGSGVTNDLWEYDTLTNAWTQKASLPATGRYTPFAFVVGTKAYIGCGNPGGPPYLQDVWVYDAIADTWTQVANFPGGNRSGLCAFSIGGFGYAGCGGNDAVDFNDLYQYNPNTNTWTRMASLPVPGSQIATSVSFAIDSLAFVGTGELAPGAGYTRDFWSYSPAGNSWTSIPALPGVSRWLGTGFSIRNKGYAGMGQDSAGNYLSDYWEYTPCITIYLSVVTLVDTNAKCNGGNNGSATASASGGTSPYTYLWNPGGQTTAVATGLAAGTYTVTVTDNTGVTGTSAVVITQPVLLSAFITGSNVACYSVDDGYAIVIANGGISPYAYSWSDGETTSSAAGLSAGIYSVTVTDSNHCTITLTDTVTQPAEINTAILVQNINCFGENTGSVSTLVSGGIVPYTYSWSPGTGSNSSYTGLTAGTYTLNVTDSLGCYKTYTVSVMQPAPIRITQYSTNTASDSDCTGSAWAMVRGGTFPYTYSWTGGGATDSITNLCSGSFCCTVIDANGCADSICVTIAISTGINDLTTDNGQLKVYPNPNNGLFTITLSHAVPMAIGIVSASQPIIEVYNVLGEKVYSETLRFTQGDNTVDLSSQPDGVYLYRVIKADGSIAGTGKIVIAK